VKFVLIRTKKQRYANKTFVAFHWSESRCNGINR